MKLSAHISKHCADIDQFPMPLAVTPPAMKKLASLTPHRNSSYGSPSRCLSRDSEITAHGFLSVLSSVRCKPRVYMTYKPLAYRQNAALVRLAFRQLRNQDWRRYCCRHRNRVADALDEGNRKNHDQSQNDA